MHAILFAQVLRPMGSRCLLEPGATATSTSPAPTSSHARSFLCTLFVWRFPPTCSARISGYRWQSALEPASLGYCDLSNGLNFRASTSLSPVKPQSAWACVWSLRASNRRIESLQVDFSFSFRTPSPSLGLLGWHEGYPCDGVSTLNLKPASQVCSGISLTE